MIRFTEKACNEIDVIFFFDTEKEGNFSGSTFTNIKVYYITGSLHIWTYCKRLYKKNIAIFLRCISLIFAIFFKKKVLFIESTMTVIVVLDLVRTFIRCLCLKVVKREAR